MSAPTAASSAAAATPGSTATQGFVIQGSAFSYDSVARLLSRLALVPDLSDVTLTSTSAAGSAAPTAAGGVQFNISATVKGAPVAPVAAVPVAPAPTDTSGTTTGVSS